MLDNNRLLASLAKSSQVDLDLATPNETSSQLALRPAGFEVGTGFIVSVASTASHVVASLGMEAFAGQLLGSMSVTYRNYKKHWEARWSALESLGVSLYSQVGTSRSVNSQLPEGSWSSFSLSGTISRNVLKDESDQFTFLQSFLDLVLAVIPLEESQTDLESVWEEEGALSRLEVNKYERSRRNRQICLDTFGYSCMICEFNFEDKYGDLGRGFAEVHHLEPVSEMASPRKLNPLEELIVLCSNCHSMAHQRKPVVQVSELKSLISRSGY